MIRYNDKGKELFRSIIEEKDAPILYGALVAQANYLVTLDRRHFFTKKIKKIEVGS